MNTIRSQRASSLALLTLTINLLAGQISPGAVADKSNLSTYQREQYVPVFITDSNDEAILRPSVSQPVDPQQLINNDNKNFADFVRDRLMRVLETSRLMNTNNRMETESRDGEMLVQVQHKPQTIIHPSFSQLERQLTDIMWLEGATSSTKSALEAGGDGGGDGESERVAGKKAKGSERKRRMSTTTNLQRNLMSPDQQINAIQSLSSLIDLDYARVYKPKIISTARGFGR